MNPILITDQTKKRIEFLLKKRSKIASHSSLSYKTTDLLYPDKLLDSREISFYLDVESIHKVGSLSWLIRKKFLRKIILSDKKSSYSLTREGRWFYISTTLRISFLSLCALADAYGIHKRLEDTDIAGFYILPKFQERFENAYSAKSIDNAFYDVVNKKLAYRYSIKSIRLFPKVFTSLKEQFDEDLTELEQWLDDVSYKRITILSRDDEILKNIKSNKELLTYLTPSG